MTLNAINVMISFLHGMWYAMLATSDNPFDYLSNQAGIIAGQFIQATFMPSPGLTTVLNIAVTGVDLWAYSTYDRHEPNSAYNLAVVFPYYAFRKIYMCLATLVVAWTFRAALLKEAAATIEAK
eukprot:CAMPEP_0117489956 /NCGR_PEP_ID=MMETSP0784-20121206/17303_1 /TAXON_ID=39447 /ORGANISM="" /LENGTH=123 /DNA_ID=CAMNT_0005284701 /DNA_START=515 /DNA_END=883 /DNA_ORIENTATION=+